MTIDEAIKQEREEAERNRKIISSGYDGEICIAQLYADDTEAINDVNDRCEQCAKYHEQLAEWLEELKDYRRFKGAKTFDNGFKNGERYGYTKAIDDFAEALIPRLTDAIYQKDAEGMGNLINNVAQELKEGEMDG